MCRHGRTGDDGRQDRNTGCTRPTTGFIGLGKVLSVQVIERGGLRRVSDWRVPDSQLHAIIGARPRRSVQRSGLAHDGCGTRRPRFRAARRDTRRDHDRRRTPRRPHAQAQPMASSRGLVAGLSLGGLYKLRARNSGGSWDFYDAYGFGPVLGPLDDYLFAEGHASARLSASRRPSHHP